MVSRVVTDAESAAAEAARVIELTAEAAIADRGRFNFAVSGGKSPWRMLEILADSRLEWSKTSLFQVDERIAPTGSPERNLTHLVLTLPLVCQAAIRPMPVGADDLTTAAAGYEYSLPDRFDLIHLGLGPDGHTASLVPDDPILEVTDRQVAMTRGEYQGTRRMSLTYKALDRARKLLFLVTGDGKQDALAKLMAGDHSIPAGRIDNANVTVVTDLAPGAPEAA
ncbi:MAG: 6-phosphogluconolactonase [Solirubrobacterales bacterium]|nr:6-phosphogluconolactonase [Solirubrobacterales bacterium]